MWISWNIPRFKDVLYNLFIVPILIHSILLDYTVVLNPQFATSALFLLTLVASDKPDPRKLAVVGTALCFAFIDRAPHPSLLCRLTPKSTSPLVLHSPVSTSHTKLALFHSLDGSPSLPKIATHLVSSLWGRVSVPSILHTSEPI